MTQSTDFNSDLRIARFLPRTVISPRTLRLVRRLTALAGQRPLSRGTSEQVDSNVTVRVFRPSRARDAAPGILFIHGGGYVIGSAAMGDRFCRRAAEELGAVVASVEYRLAPEHSFPTPLEDCYAALTWLADQPDVNPRRIAIVGESAGGGLAAALAQLTTWSTEVRPVLQALSYPMLDDRTAARTDIDPDRLRMWDQRSNRLAWRAYLGAAADGQVPPLAAPARCADLSGLPPAWIGVGTNDLFYDEDVAYAERLRQAGVPCTLHVADGAYHGFDLIESRARISRTFQQARLDALREALDKPEPRPRATRATARSASPATKLNYCVPS
ncbi:alpha/beta hydrolase [Nocardia sp. NPDC055321]